MKTILSLILIIILSFPAFSDTETIEQQLKNANRLYAQNEFKKAAELYEQIISEKYKSSELFFNAANTYYRLNETGKAIYYYEKAKMLTPNDNDINYNLQLAKLRVENLPPEVPVIFPVRIFRQISLRISAEFWAYLSVFFFAVFLSFLFLYFTAKNSKSKKIKLLTAIIILFFSSLTFVFMHYQVSFLNAHNQAIVVSKEIKAKSSPDASANNLFKIYEGYKVKIENEKGNWCEIVLTDGKKAWLKKENLMIL